MLFPMCEICITDINKMVYQVLNICNSKMFSTISHIVLYKITKYHVVTYISISVLLNVIIAN